jgi:hypothetical protein
MKLVPRSRFLGEKNKRKDDYRCYPCHGSEYADHAAALCHGLFIENTADAIGERGDDGEEKIDGHTIGFPAGLCVPDKCFEFHAAQCKLRRRRSQVCLTWITKKH